MIYQKKIIHYKMDNLPNEKLCEIIEHLTDYTDIQRLSRVSKRLYEMTSLCVRDILTPAKDIPVESIIRFQNLRKVEPTIYVAMLGDLMYIASFPHLEMATFGSREILIDVYSEVEWVIAFIYQYCNGLNLLNPSLGRLNRNLLGKKFGFFFDNYYALADGIFRTLDADIKIPIVRALAEFNSLRGVQINNYNGRLSESVIRQLFVYDNIRILEYESDDFSFKPSTADYLIELINNLPIESIIDTSLEQPSPENNRFLFDQSIISVNTVRIIRAPLFANDIEKLIDKYPNLQEACLYISGKSYIGTWETIKTYNEIIEILKQILQNYPNLQICLKAYDLQTLDGFLEAFEQNGGDLSRIIQSI